MHDGESCPHCDQTYAGFRTGHNFSDVRNLFWSGSDDPTDWVNKRRHTVLGRWREIKQSMWREHLEMCELQAAYASELETLESVETVSVVDEPGLDLGSFEAPFIKDGSPVPF